MTIRFPTEAANDDRLTPDAPAASRDDEAGPDVGADGTPRGRADGSPGTAPSSRDDLKDEGKPGKGINAPGFVKDKDDPDRPR